MPRELGADWAGDTDEEAPEKMAAIIDTTPVWKPIVEALKQLTPGGRLVINAIRKEDSDKDYLLNLKYHEHMWMEKEIKSVANVSPLDVQEFLRLAGEIPIKSKVQEYAFEDTNRALTELKKGNIKGAKVLKNVIIAGNRALEGKNFLEHTEYYELGEDLGREILRERISEEFTAVFEKSVKQKKRYVDTFDFRLCGEGLYLLCDKKSFILHNSHLSRPISELSSGGRKEPKFWWELPDSELRDELRPRIDVRALLPVMEVQKISTPVRILNRDKKTVINLTLEEIKAAGDGASRVKQLCVCPVRGYRRELNRFKSCLSGLKLKESEGDYIKAILRSVGKDPADYSSKLKLDLEPGLTSLEALKIIMKRLLRTIKLNEEGIIKDIDIEFLHDFRVAVRRTRSALTQIKGVFPEDEVSHFKERFSRLGRATNLLRDLDIYLLDKDRYRAMLPEELSPGLEQMFSIFSKQRKGAHRDIVKFLRSKEYREIIESWEKFLETPDESINEPNSDVPVIELSNRIIRKKYKRIIKDGSLITPESPDTELHKLRIECKKLRYMIEFFSSLYQETEIKELVRHLKRLQDNLGEFNDLSVQRESLKAFIDRLDPKDAKQRESIVSSGGLISVLYEQQKEIRSEFAERFKEFKGKETKAVFRKLFMSNTEPAA